MSKSTVVHQKIFNVIPFEKDRFTRREKGKDVTYELCQIIINKYSLGETKK